MDEMYLFEYLMENVAIFSPIISLLQILSLVFVILYMNYTAKYKNHDLSVVWYILAVFFPVPVAIAFAIKSRKFRHENTKVCSQCGDKYPETFSMCSRCLIDLPELDDPKRMKKKKLGKIFCVSFWVVTVATIVTFVLLFTVVIQETISMIGEFDASSRMPIETVAGETLYFDKEGEVYLNSDDVPLYDRNGTVYKRTIIEQEDELLGMYGETYYIDDKGNTYDSYLCYVDEEGYFYFDKDCEIDWDDSDYDYDYDLEEELENCEDWFDEENYRYYDDVYVDDEGNIYYYADEASWNEKGELITAENDPNPPTVTE